LADIIIASLKYLSFFEISLDESSNDLTDLDFASLKNSFLDLLVRATSTVFILYTKSLVALVAVGGGEINLPFSSIA